jgi:hypothetical protein
MALQQFENTITSIIHILRSENIIGMDSVNHCISFVLIKYMTIEKCNKFGIPEKYAYDNFLIDDSFNDEKILQKYYSYNTALDEDNLMTYFKYIFNYTPHMTAAKIKSPQNFVNIFNKMSIINIDELLLDIHKLNYYCDIIFMIYDSHIKSEKYQYKLDIKQYSSHLTAIQHILGSHNQTIKKNNSNSDSDSDIDEETRISIANARNTNIAMGIKFFNAYCTGIDWASSKTSMFGFDIDENITNMVSINLLFETGELFNTALMHTNILQPGNKFSDGTVGQRVFVMLPYFNVIMKGAMYSSCYINIHLSQTSQ